jgi:hypothetical protein
MIGPQIRYCIIVIRYASPASNKAFGTNNKATKRNGLTA